MRILASSAFVMIASAAGLFLHTGGFQAFWSFKLSLFLTDPDPPETPMHREAASQHLMAAASRGTNQRGPTNAADLALSAFFKIKHK